MVTHRVGDRVAFVEHRAVREATIARRCTDEEPGDWILVEDSDLGTVVWYRYDWELMWLVRCTK